MPRGLRKAVSFVGTLVVLVGALVAASIVAVIIVSLFNALSTQPYVVAGEAYYINATNFTHLHVVLYNVGKGGAILDYMYIYAPINVSGNITELVLKVYSNGSVKRSDTNQDVGRAIFRPSPPVVAPQGGSLEVTIMTTININASYPKVPSKVIGIAVFDKDATIITFEQIAPS